MLTFLQIRDFALIDHAELELSAGLTVLTGETGAGKSMLVDALGLLLGDRAEPRLIREGSAQAEVVGDFDVSSVPAATAWLAAQGLESSGQCLVRRVLVREGRSRIFVNGTPTTLQALRDLGEVLADIHGQHDHQSLLRPDEQRRMLDARGQHDALLEAVAGAHHAWQKAARAAAELASNREARSARRELLRFQVDELADLAPQAGEMEQLELELRRLAEIDRLREVSGSLAEALYAADEGSVHDQLARAARELGPLAELAPELHSAMVALDEARILVHDAATGLRQCALSSDGDPARLAYVERRLEELHAAARKYRIVPDLLASLAARLAAELAEEQDPETALAELETAAATAAAQYRAAAVQLGQARERTAARLTAEVTASLERLGMPGGRFTVALLPLADAAGSAHGEERVQFQVSANPGQPLQPLQQVVSGGELSRISLAIQAATAASLAVPSVVYDEVDVGIGGRVAEIVGKLLRELAADRQVFCITHLPQVAAQGQHHLQVAKASDGQSTRTTVRELDAAARVQELARMLGGVEITAQTRAHAEEMIALAR